MAAAETEAFGTAGAMVAGLAGAARKASSRARNAGNDRSTEVRRAVVVMAVKVAVRPGRPGDAARRAGAFTRRWRRVGGTRAGLLARGETGLGRRCRAAARFEPVWATSDGSVSVLIRI
ncbi:hypothetical protein Aiant_54010 [Actinoplanes ianthinogenes]|uniref:Uncharacterized protein n=1 Tax=Actinoplanes ianthinogenes TaxID=122358 RepID=A0ABN6CGR6_9ACTN|nr:hypothetical protein Aiant_54010 [Actinoplanes ianthinogenes]